MSAINNLDLFVGKKIKFFRNKMNWPLKVLASQIDVSIQQLQRYEQGVNKISATLLYQVAKIFEVSIKCFFEGIEEESSLPGDVNVFNILLVEDDSKDEFLLRKALSDFPEKLNIYSFHDGQEALNFIKAMGTTTQQAIQFPIPDLIMVDLHLPAVNGLELLKEIKRRKELQSIPVIMLTNSISNQNMQNAYSLQASGFIRKSFSFQDFKEQLHKVLKYWTQTVLLPTKAS
ncbi:response regulator [Rickettsiales endosymbiont of Stachyamoeba lipophora]|uniref:response regulator n=1 Tax=Rickettsiales endosymbiont of Stachyamoeba lipophora TaxID=2486578 RepID=UPI000F647A90|nr:response regulator [Rickettsiales endosymbiont of Stachyamoeba lipophora]AZL16257.1 response regulator [Rickettsiales endosymbiont of Stachyamoeba lipophora]